MASNGGVASAQNYTASYSGLHFEPSYANDGVRYMGPNGDHYWRDEHGLPTWVQVDFSGEKVLHEIDVITARDDYGTQADPGATQTFGNYGTTAYKVEYWNSQTAGWVVVPGGNFTGNSLVWRKLSFPAVTTTKIKVSVTATSDSVVRLMEVEAWGYDGQSLQWLVADQLGTPRMVFDKTGALANVKRHDYLPFGEELFAGTGGRTTAQGYSASDGVRQKFTSKERDNETGLDYSAMQGRFTSVDPLMASGSTGSPQSWNRYSYAYNNPLRFTDPSGMLPGDFYSEEGKRLGTDGVNDGNVYVVPNDAQAQQIEAADKTGGTTQVSAVSSAVELPSLNVRQAIGNALERSNNPTSDDKKGGFHEEGVTWGTNASGAEQVIAAAPGPVSNPLTDTHAQIALSNFANPADNGALVSVGGTAHIHPKGEISVITGAESKPGVTVIGGTTITTTGSFRQPTSPRDSGNAVSGQTHIVVGARDKKVYIYGAEGVRATFPLKQFLK
jgi:RHS repeat-associated protein